MTTKLKFMGPQMLEAGQSTEFVFRLTNDDDFRASAMVMPDPRQAIHVDVVHNGKNIIAGHWKDMSDGTLAMPLKMPGPLPDDALKVKATNTSNRPTLFAAVLLDDDGLDDDGAVIPRVGGFVRGPGEAVTSGVVDSESGVVLDVAKLQMDPEVRGGIANEVARWMGLDGQAVFRAAHSRVIAIEVRHIDAKGREEALTEIVECELTDEKMSLDGIVGIVESATVRDAATRAGQALYAIYFHLVAGQRNRGRYPFTVKGGRHAESRVSEIERGPGLGDARQARRRVFQHAIRIAPVGPSLTLGPPEEGGKADTIFVRSPPLVGYDLPPTTHGVF